MRLVAMLVVLGCLVPSAALAQNKFGLTTTGWEMGLALGDAKDFHEDVSLRGITVDTRFYLMPALTLGVGLSRQLFDDEQPKTTYELPSGAITAKLYHRSEIYQWKGFAHYYFMAESIVKPFVGIGLGVAWLDRTVQVADFAYQDTQAGFVMTPEVGLLATLKAEWPAGLLAVYKYNFTTVNSRDINNFSYISWAVGGYISY